MTNVIFLTIDSIRFDYFTGANSHLRSPSITPNLDKWAVDVLQFPQVYSPGPSTGLTFPALLSGSYSSSYRERYGLSQKRKMLAEYMREAGYTTCAFNSNPYLTSAFNYNRGFDCFYDDFIFQGTKKVHALFKKAHLSFRSLFKEPYWTAPSMNKAIVSWIKENKEKPFFIWTHYMDVHGPYIPKKGIKLLSHLKANMLWQKATRSPQTITSEEKQILIDTYIEEIECFDRHIQQLFDAIPEDTVVIITGDHGEFLGEKGEYAHNGLLYNKLLHVPLLMKIPGYDLSAANLDTPISTMDIVPTLLDYIGAPPSDIVDGVSFLPQIKGQQVVPRRQIISEEGSYHMSMIDYPWKLIANYHTEKFEVFNIETDPEENENLITTHPEKFEELNAGLQEHREKMNLRREGIDEDVGANHITNNEELVKRMRQLGYME